MTEENQNPNTRANTNGVEVENINIGGSVGGSTVIGSGNVVGYTSEQVSALLEQISKTFQPNPLYGRCPYKGLDYFEEEDAELFFGRERLVEELVGRVKESRRSGMRTGAMRAPPSLLNANLIKH